MNNELLKITDPYTYLKQLQDARDSSFGEVKANYQMEIDRLESDLGLVKPLDLAPEDMMTQDKLLAIINEQGIENIRFMAPFKTKGMSTPLGLMIGSDDPEELVECRITEKRYKVADRYKISLTPANAEWYTEHYYLLDLCSLIDRGIISIKGGDE